MQEKYLEQIAMARHIQEVIRNIEQNRTNIIIKKDLRSPSYQKKQIGGGFKNVRSPSN